MSAAYDYKPKFFDIRVRPPKEGEKTKAETDVYTLKPGEKPCDWPECRKAGATKAPKSREMLNEHYWFCQGHAAEYNKNWDYFAGMNEAETAGLADFLLALKNQGLTLMVIEHHMDLIMRVCDEIVVLNFGRKIAHDHPDAIATHAEVQEAYLGKD